MDARGSRTAGHPWGPSAGAAALRSSRGPTDVAGYAYGPVFLAVAMGCFSAVVAGHRRAAWPVVATVWVGHLVLAHWLYRRLPPGDDAAPPGGQELGVAARVVAIVAAAEFVRVRREQWADRRAEVLPRRRTSAAPVRGLLRYDHQERVLFQVHHDLRRHALAPAGRGELHRGPAPCGPPAGMRERAAALGGTIGAGARPYGGFRVRAELPLPAGGAAHRKGTP